jgi:hypothetical protein
LLRTAGASLHSLPLTHVNLSNTPVNNRYFFVEDRRGMAMASKQGLYEDIGSVNTEEVIIIF